MSPRPESVIFIDKQLVWMTCGVEVGYQVLLAPRTSGVEWLDVLEQAFPHFEIGGQQLRAAEVTYEGGRAMAVAFFDPSHCDSSSRPIKHFMLWLDVEPMVFDKAATVSVPELMQQLAPAFSMILDASRYISEPDICRQAWEKQSERSLRLVFSGKNTPVKNAGAKSSTVKSNLSMDALSSDDEEALVFPKKFMVMAIVMVVLAIIAALFQVFGLA
jgi:hypothetical protein